MRISSRATIVLLTATFAIGACKSSPNADGDGESAARPSAAASESEASSDNSEVRWQQPVTVATGDAYAGPWRMNDSKFHYVDDASVALTSGGSSAVVWVDNRDKNVNLQIFDDGGVALFDAPTNVSRSPDIFSWLPSVVVDPDDPERMYVLWQEIVFSGGSHGGEAFFARSVDGGASFDEPINLSTSKAGDGKGRLTDERWHNGSLDLALAPDGDIFAAWTEYEGRLWLRRSTDGGRSFEEPVHVAGTADVPARGPSLVATDDAVHLAWAVGGDDAADVRYSRSSDDGRNFTDPVRIARTEGHSDAPSIATDDAGTVHVVFGESPSGMFGRYHVRYALRTADQSAFSASRALTSPDAGSSANFPTLVVGANGSALVVWEHYPEEAERPMALGFAHKRSGEDAFVAGGLVPATATSEYGFNGSLQGMLHEKLAHNAAGRIAVVNSRFAPGEGSRIRLMRGVWAQ